MNIVGRTHVSLFYIFSSQSINVSCALTSKFRHHCMMRQQMSELQFDKFLAPQSIIFMLEDKIQKPGKVEMVDSVVE